jgi:uncharacterized protein
MKSIKFKNATIDMAGNLYFPEGFSEDRKYAAIVCVHPSGGVKEQTSGLYAGKLAREGFVTLAYDAAYQGESEGTPRHCENPYQRVEDIKSAVTYLSCTTTSTPIASARSASARAAVMCAEPGRGVEHGRHHRL